MIQHYDIFVLRKACTRNQLFPSTKISPPSLGRRWPAHHTRLFLKWQDMLDKDLLNGLHSTMVITGHLLLRCNRQAPTTATSNTMEEASYTHPRHQLMVTHLFRILSQFNNLHPQRSRTTLTTRGMTKGGIPLCRLLCTQTCRDTIIGKAPLQHHSSDPWRSTRLLRIFTMAMTQGTLQTKVAMLLPPQIAILRLHHSLTAAMGVPRMVCSSHNRNHNIIILPRTCRNLHQTLNSSRFNR